MRALILGSILCVAVGVGGNYVLKFAGAPAQWSAALTAMFAAIAALVLAELPLLLVRGCSQTAVMQAGLAATLIHMMLLLFTAAVVIFWRMPVGQTFVFWLMAMYIITIVALIAAISGVVRGAADAAKTSSHSSHGQG